MPISLILSKAANVLEVKRLIAHQLGRWLLFTDYGDNARRNMAIVWQCVGGFILVDVIWLQASSLSFARSNWKVCSEFLFYINLAGAFFSLVSYRLRGKADRVALFLRAALQRTELLSRGCLVIGVSGTAGMVFSYLATSAAYPLTDHFLAEFDFAFGFNWPAFLKATNSNPVLASLLTHAYQSTLLVTEGVLIWLSIRGRGEKLAEFLAILNLTSVGVGLGLLIAPAAGAFAYFNPAPQLFSNFGAPGEMWSFSKVFIALRDGSLSVIDVSVPEGIVSFPSFHTVLGIITTYALRDDRWLMVCVLALNAIMVISTLPVGGHHLVDVLAGVAISIVAIAIVREEPAIQQTSGESSPMSA
jgi:membrane-associated phospholipid phosphatase